jgi:hypothetical protein
MDDNILLGCCGAYCRTCKEFGKALCKGCKTGYADGSRDLARAKCKIKLCCMSKDYISCADCPEFENCEILESFNAKRKYRYKKALSFIRKEGYAGFFTIANQWTNAYGKYNEEL